MASAGTVSVNVVARVNKFLTGMDKVQNRMKRTRKNFQLFKRAFQAAIVVEGIRRLSRALFSVNEQVMALQKQARRAEVFGLTAGQWQEMSYAVGQTGISVDQFATSMQRLMRNAGAAQTGNKEAIKNFKALNMEMADMAKMTPIELVTEFTRQLQMAGNDMVKMARAQKIVDSEGVPVFQQLSKHLHDMNMAAKEFRAMGGGITPAQVALVDKMASTTGRIAERWRLLKETLLFDNAEEVKAFFDYIERVVNNIVNGAKYIEKNLGGLGNIFNRLTVGAFDPATYGAREDEDLRGRLNMAGAAIRQRQRAAGIEPGGQANVDQARQDSQALQTIARNTAQLQGMQF